MWTKQAIADALLLGALLTAAVACERGDPPAAERARNGEAVTYALAVDVPFAELELPADSRDGRPPNPIVLDGWREGPEGRFQVAFPARAPAIRAGLAPEGMEVVDASQRVVPHESQADGERPSWSLDREMLTLHADARPASGGLFLRYPLASAREAALNLAFSGKPPQEFVRTRVRAGPESRAGLLLPAPASVAWDLRVPPGGLLDFSPGLAPPEVSDGPPSDGVRLSAELIVDGRTVPLWQEAVGDARFPRVRIDLDAWAGRQVRLRFRSEPAGSTRFDYAFLAEPVLAALVARPRRVVLIFVDTLRSDHMTVYGYRRETTPATAALAARGVVFDNARSVAPWTLPSARSLLTGRRPDRYDDGPTLQGRLRREGWATALFGANLFLAPQFRMQRDWGLHRIDTLASAEKQVDRALAWLRANAHRDALLLLHLVDPHLPYLEPPSHRRLFAADPPAELPQDVFERDAVLRARLTEPEDHEYLRGRYDNNIRYLDEQLQRLYTELGAGDIVVLVSDHGEEFWEHGGFEHGHTLYDELLRVPLILRAPGLEPGRVREPVSLLDVTPTVLDLLGLEHGPGDGASLVPLARGEEPARRRFAERAVAFGHPLYGGERWGVLRGDLKYAIQRGVEQAYDVGRDPRERLNLLAGADGAALAEELRASLASALGREVALGYRFWARSPRRVASEDTVVELTVPGGVEAAFLSEDPRGLSRASVEVAGERVTARWQRGYWGSRELWIVPAAPLARATPGLRGTLRFGAGSAELAVGPEAPPPAPGSVLASAQLGPKSFFLAYGVAVLPGRDPAGISAYDPELAAALEEMGYLLGPGSE